MTSKITNYRHDLMRGKTRVEKKSSSNIVRVFVSSTFADMTDERNVLYAHAYPELRNFCQSLGLEFQVIDMRWGVRDTASVDHSTSALCLLEVRTCKRVSLGPYFVVFFGDRYGYQPLPTAIPDTEFGILQQVAEEQDIDKQELLQKWFKLDKNTIPHSRILEPITSHFSHFDDVDPKYQEQKEIDRKEWQNTFNDLTSILKSTSDIAVKRGLCRKGFQHRFHKSITQMEIEEALNNKTEGSFLAYNREISDLQKNTDHERARIYVDMIEGKNEIHKERQKLLKALKKTVKQHAEKKKNTFKKYDITWKTMENTQTGGESPEGKKEKNYLDVLSNDFVLDMKRSIMRCVDEKTQSNKEETSSDSLLQEVIHHANFEVLKTSDFCGREQFISEISAMINDSENNHPILLVGSSGSGKTSLMAKLVENERIKSPKSNLVFRFLGTSPDSSNIHKLLTSLILQISTAYGEKLPPTYQLQNFSDVVELFSQLLRKISKILGEKGDGSLILFLDSIDQLSKEDGAHRMTWLPKTTPSKVTVIISSLPEPDFEIVPAMRRHIPESNVKTVHGLNVETAKEILQKCLGNVHRCLTESQSAKVLQAFEKSPYPLFLKLMLEQAKRWRSHDNVDNLILAETSRAAISQFYDRLEKDHGRTLVSRALGYIVAARDGVTENELQDLLSLDNEVMHDVYEYWSPPSENTARIPSFAWTRLNYDLGEYIVQRQATGHTVLALYHRQFIEVARQRYLQKEDAIVVYINMSEFFSGVYGEGKAKKLDLKMWDESREVDRKVAQQPIQFSNEVFNVRKLRELPHCLLRAERWDELNSQVLANARWIKTKIKAFSIKEILEDYNIALQEKSDVEIRLIRDAIKLAKPTLEFPAGVRNHIFTELYCRLKFFTDKFPQYLGSLISQCYKYLEENDDELLLPLTGNFQPPGGPLRTTITGFHKPVTFLKFSPGGDIFAASSAEGSLMIWDTVNDEVIHRIDAHTDSITYIAFSESAVGNKIATSSKDNTVKVFHLDNGNMCFEATMPQLENTKCIKLFLSEEKILCVTDNEIVTWNLQSKAIENRMKFETSITQACSCLSNDKWNLVVGHQDGKCTLFDVKKGEELDKLKEPPSTSQVVGMFYATESDQQLVIIWKDGCVAVFNSDTFVVLDTVSNDEREVADCVKAHGGALVAISFIGAVEIYSVKKGKIERLATLDDLSSSAMKIRFVDNQTLAVANENKTVTLWSLKDGGECKMLNTWEGMGASIDHIEIGKNVGVTASSQTFYLKVWDLRHDDAVQLEAGMSLTSLTSSISSQGRHFAHLKGNNIIVQNFKKSNQGNHDDMESEKHIVPNFSAKKVKSLHFTSKEDNLVVLKNDGVVEKFPNPASHTDEVTNKNRSTFRYEEGHILSLYVTGTNIYAVVKPSNNDTSPNRILRIDSDDLTILSTITVRNGDIEGEITALCVAGASSTIVLGTTKGNIYLFHTASNDGVTYQKILLSSKHQHAITCLTTNDAGDMLFSGSKGRTRRLWSLRNNTATPLHDLHFDSLLEGGVTCAQFSHDDKYLFAGSNERSITIWDVQTGLLIGAQYVYAPVINLVMRRDGHLIYTSELGYIAAAKFRPSSKHAIASVKSGKNLSNRSSTCEIM